MPTASLRPCSGGCGARVTSGRCGACAPRHDAKRRQSRTLTYSEKWWRAWRHWYISNLAANEIAAVCGAALPTGPCVNLSQCGESDILVSPHLHHEPELTEAEKA